MSNLPPEFNEWLRPEPDDPEGKDVAGLDTPASDQPTTVHSQTADDATTVVPAHLDDATTVVPAPQEPRVVPVIPAPASTPVIPAAQKTPPAVIPQSTPRRAPVVPAPPPSVAPARSAPVNTSSAPVNTGRAAYIPPPRTPARNGSTAVGQTRRRKPKRRRHIVRWLVLALVAYVTAVVTVFALSVNKIDAMPAVSSGSGAGTNILMVGSDSRAGLTPEQQAELTTGAVEGNRTDTIMVMHIPWIGTPTLMSIPRDSYVEIPGYGYDKINAAFAVGGPQLLIQTVEQTTGLRIDNFVEIGLAGIANTTDALGGVRLCPTQNYDDELSGLYVQAGCQLMDGPTALAYVRMRYQDPRGDLGRIERQQEFISSTIKRAFNPLTWLLPWRAFGAASAAGSALTVSEGTGIVDLSRLGTAMGMIAVGFGDSTTVPTQEGTYDIDGQNVVLWNEPAAEQLFNSLK